MNTVPKLVLSRGEPDLSWGPAKRIGADLAAERAELKVGDGKDVATACRCSVAGAKPCASSRPDISRLRERCNCATAA